MLGIVEKIFRELLSSLDRSQKFSIEVFLSCYRLVIYLTSDSMATDLDLNIA